MLKFSRGRPPGPSVVSGIVWGGLSLSNPSKCGVKLMKYPLPEEACAFSQMLGNHFKALLNVKIFPGEDPPDLPLWTG